MVTYTAIRFTDMLLFTGDSNVFSYSVQKLVQKCTLNYFIHIAVDVKLESYR